MIGQSHNTIKNLKVALAGMPCGLALSPEHYDLHKSAVQAAMVEAGSYPFCGHGPQLDGPIIIDHLSVMHPMVVEQIGFGGNMRELLREQESKLIKSITRLDGLPKFEDHEYKLKSSTKRGFSESEISKRRAKKKAVKKQKSKRRRK